MTEKVNVGMIGAGYIVPKFMNGAIETDGFHFRSILSIPQDEEKLKELCKQYKIDYYTTDIEEMLNDEQLNTVYIGCPNSFHYLYAKQALLHGKNVIVEKPFCAYESEAQELFSLAKEKGLVIFEAITIQTLPNYHLIKKLLPQIGDVKLIDINFSQYSSRYDRFKAGVVLPVFDPSMQGGALMDLGVYNLHFVSGLFGEPKEIKYYPNIEKGIDTSGILYLQYDGFNVSCTVAKNSKAPMRVCIHGDCGYIKTDSSSSTLKQIDLKLNNEDEVAYNLNEKSAFYYELTEYLRILAEKDFDAQNKANEQTLLVVRLLEKARKSTTMSF